MTKPLLLAAALPLMMHVCTAQTTPLPYSTGFESGNASWSYKRTGIQDPYSFWGIDNQNPYAGAYALFHNYPTGGNTQFVDDWVVSPAFNFASGGKVDSVRHLFSGLSTPQAGDTVAIYLLQGSPDPALAAKTLLYDFRGANYVADDKWKKTTGIPIHPVSGIAYVAFRYRTANAWLDVSFDNLALSANSTGIRQVYTSAKDFTIMPVPAANSLSIATAVPFIRICLYDLTGKQVYAHDFQERIDISQLAPGSYLLELSDRQAQKGVAIITKR